MIFFYFKNLGPKSTQDNVLNFVDRNWVDCNWKVGIIADRKSYLQEDSDCCTHNRMECSEYH